MQRRHLISGPSKNAEREEGGGMLDEMSTGNGKVFICMVERSSQLRMYMELPERPILHICWMDILYRCQIVLRRRAEAWLLEAESTLRVNAPQSQDRVNAESQYSRVNAPKQPLIKTWLNLYK